MFKVRMPDAKMLRDAITAISTIVDEGTFKIDGEGMKLRAMDPTRVAMVDFAMQKTAFEEFAIDGETRICLNLNELLKLLKRAGKDEIVELRLDEETGQFVTTMMGNYVRTFRMPTLEASEEDIPTPKIEFKAKVTLTTDGLHRSLEDVALVSDYVRIEADEEKVVMRAKGDIMGADIELKKGSDALLSLDVKEPSKSSFPLSYLSEIVKAASATSEIVTIEFSNDMPIRLDFKQRYDGTLTYYLAPRIEVE
ncbi:MAG: proliferating cell nuclear antigen (pcna) [Nitrososphaerota archaeon]|nr:proliferating cell nuclear antigen (pcna) [Candidatus Bathyarchaeota archaeon]MDW8049192.1 proliferating cell nuclear antigen (pcna) [Nitrososphaerota archaeon]